MEKIEKLNKLISYYNLDGYIVPKNDEFFNEYIPQFNDRLKFISSFSGSYGIALIMKKKGICLWTEDINCKQKLKVENYLI